MLNYRVIGNNPDNDWVVMVHGAGGNMETWFRQVPDFARHFNLLLVDLIGHGESQEVSLLDTLSFEVIADQVIEVVDHLKIKECHFLALSIGCVVVRVIAERYPERVKKVVLAGAITSLNFKAKLIIWATNQFKRIIPFDLIRWLLVRYLIPQKDTNKFYMKGAEKVCFQTFLLWMTIVNKMGSLLVRLFSEKCDIPTLYMMGEKDELFLQEARHIVKHNEESSSLVVVPNAGHACNIENKVFFNRVSIEYLLA